MTNKFKHKKGGTTSPYRSNTSSSSCNGRRFVVVPTILLLCLFYTLLLLHLPSVLSFPAISSTTTNTNTNTNGISHLSPRRSSTPSVVRLSQQHSYIQLQDVPDYSTPPPLNGLPLHPPQHPPPTSNDNNPETSRWLRWMTLGVSSKSSSSTNPNKHTNPKKNQPTHSSSSHISKSPTISPGQPRQSDELKFRDPIALGGLPRSERYAASDWLHNTLNLPNSAILRDIRFPVLSMTVWAFAIAVVRRKLLVEGKVGMAMGMCLPAGPHGMMVSMLGLLLVFRTNSAYQRFAEGRKIWEEILSTARDLSRLAKLYEKQMGSAKLRRVQRLLAAFPYLLRSRIRPTSIMKRLNDPNFVRDPEFSIVLYPDHATSDADAEAAAVASSEELTGMSRRKTRELYWVDKRTLPWRLLPSLTKEECARAQNRPLWVCDRMAKELHTIPDAPDFTARERLALVSKVDALSRAIGACERIHQTVVPLNYARHALRSLTVWLLSLPFALVKDLGLMTGVILFVMSWMLFGVYEIGYSIEDPFQGTLRLSILCDAIRRDVLGDEIIRNTAFVLEDEGGVSSTKEGAEVKKKVDYLEDDADDYGEDEDDDEMYEPTEIEEIRIDSMGMPHFA